MSLTRSPLLIVFAVAIMLAASALRPTPTHAAITTYTVTSISGASSGACNAGSCTSLYAAVQAAANGDIVTFGPGVIGVIQLQDTLQITKSITIVGPGASNLALDGRQAVGVLAVSASATVRGVTIRRGKADYGGGVSQTAGVFTLMDSVVTDNVANSGGGGIYLGSGNNGAQTVVISTTIDGNRASVGGGIIESGPTGLGAYQYSMTFTRSTISNNQASDQAGAIYATDDARVLLQHTTVSGNSATNQVGGITAAGSYVALRYVTVAGNTAPLYPQYFFQNSNGLEVGNSLIAAGTVDGPCGNAPVASLRYNLSNSVNCLTSTIVTDDKLEADLKIGPLALNAPGTTRTHALLADSPAINGVPFSATDCGHIANETDQRGVPRPGATYGGNCDIGAYELARITPTITQLTNQSLNEDETLNLAVTVGDADTPVGQLTVTASGVDLVLFPSGSLVVGGSSPSFGVQLKPAKNRSGTTSVTVTVSDGTSQASTNFVVMVQPVNDAPVNTVPASQPLQVANNATLPFDSAHNAAFSIADVDAASVEVTFSVTAGTLDYTGTPTNITVAKTGSSLKVTDVNAFIPMVAYAPPADFVGAVTLTMTTSDLGSSGSGGVMTDTDTVTINVSASKCSPRATVKVTTAVVGGKLQATVQALPLATQAANSLKALSFGVLKNAKVTINGTPMTSNGSYTVPGSPTTLMFQVERAAPGAPTTVPLTVTDECGAWPTFVGGGEKAGF